MRNNKGVTLVALVITIIVLLILAGVSLAMLTGDSGILSNADDAKAKTIVSNAKNAIELAYMDIKTTVYALEAANSSVQAVEMDPEDMAAIAKNYVDENLILTTALTNGIRITYTDDVVENDEVVSADITYNPTPAEGEPRVKIKASWMPEEENN